MKIISIDGTRYALPEGMPAKDIQALAGFLVTLIRVESEYAWGAPQVPDGYMHYLGRGSEVRLENLDLTAKAEAQRIAAEGRAAYDAKKSAAAAE